MKDQIEDGSGDDLIPNDIPPVGESLVAGEVERPVFVPTADEPEEEVGAQQVDRKVADLVDEIGLLSLSRKEASLFFWLVLRRYERGSLIVSGNKSFLTWAEVFNHLVLATANLDRLYHTSKLSIQGACFQLTKKTAGQGCSGSGISKLGTRGRWSHRAYPHTHGTTLPMI